MKLNKKTNKEILLLLTLIVVLEIIMFFIVLPLIGKHIGWFERIITMVSIILMLLNWLHFYVESWKMK